MVKLGRAVMRGYLLAIAGFATVMVPVYAQQQGLNQEAWQVQQAMGSGALNQGQAARLDGQINQIEQQTQAARAMNGGQLNPLEQQQLHSEMQGVRQNMRTDAMQNGYNPQAANSMFGTPHHHHHQFTGVMSPYNQNQQPGQYPYRNMQYQSQYPYPDYPNNGYPNAQPGYGYNGYPNQQYQNSNQQGGLSGAAQMLKKLF